MSPNTTWIKPYVRIKAESRTTRRQRQRLKTQKGIKEKEKGSNKGTGNLKRDKACTYCDKWHTAPDDHCWTLDKHKNTRPKKGPQQKTYGHLPPKEAEDSILWKCVNVDVITHIQQERHKENEPCMR
jgi:hypothetical protein